MDLPVWVSYSPRCGSCRECGPGCSAFSPRPSWHPQRLFRGFVAASRAAPARLSIAAFEFAKEWPMVFGYSIFVLLANADILVGYFLLPRGALDVYAASALLPKAITMMTFAVTQVLLPVIVDQKADGLSYRQSVVKAIAMTLVLGAVGAAFLWLAVPWVQGTRDRHSRTGLPCDDDARCRRDGAWRRPRSRHR